ncbi:hypothetical protein [Pseudoduganella lutea]|uniref:hypothetical protein n=1 Tax=Pseudoduganella lutea TaxID=321985 RepID=UPI001A92F5CF|nr:hypothetical protein [Pseudoduganella lutea]
MWTRASAIFCLFLCTSLVFAKDTASAGSDAAIRKRLIKESIASYPGSCACPYNMARNGSSCGRRSAWSRQGGYGPLCFEQDVSKEMIEEWRKAHAASLDSANEGRATRAELGDERSQH